MTIGISSPRRRIMLIIAAALPSRPFLPQSTTMQPMAASVWTTISASSMRRARTTWKPILLDGDRDLAQPVAFEIVGVEGRSADEEGETPEEIHQ